MKNKTIKQFLDFAFWLVRFFIKNESITNVASRQAL